MAFWDGRYDDLNDDPAVWLGMDLRAAYWSGSNSAFPMQLDVAAGVHPIHHVTFSATLGASRDARYAVFARNAFMLIHELPSMTWAKAGVFLPAYGLYSDDHTSFTRDGFEMDTGGLVDRAQRRERARQGRHRRPRRREAGGVAAPVHAGARAGAHPWGDDHADGAGAVDAVGGHGGPGRPGLDPLLVLSELDRDGR